MDVLIGGLMFPEVPRWHDGKLWFSDYYAGTVHTIGTDGRCETVLTVDGGPGGLGFYDDGTLLVVSRRKHCVLGVRNGETKILADLSPFIGNDCNDMLVDPGGRAYVGNLGYDLHAKETPRPTRLMLIERDGTVKVAAEDVVFPNGGVITQDRKTFILAETYVRRRLTAFSIHDDGTLFDRRLFAQFPEDTKPDGICLDAEGAVWVADIGGHRLMRVMDGGRIVQQIDLGDHRATACTLGGADGRTLYVTTCVQPGPASVALKQGRVEATRVAVPRGGFQ